MHDVGVTRRSMLGLLGAILGACATPPPPEAWVGVDLQGRNFEPLANSNAKVAVLVFVAPTCPIANRYMPMLDRLESDFEGQVQMTLVYAGGGVDAADVRRHLAAFDVSLRAFLDPHHAWVRRFDVEVTPEAVVLGRSTQGWRLLYHGRIDDRARVLGSFRAEPAHTELYDAIGWALAGGTSELPSVPGVGCRIEAR